MDKRLEKIQDQINEVKKTGMSVGELSDTYHSFNDLYDHRMVLTAFAMMSMPYAWKAKKHDDNVVSDWKTQTELGKVFIFCKKLYVVLCKVDGICIGISMK